MTDLREYIRERSRLEQVHADNLYKLAMSTAKSRRWDLEKEFGSSSKFYNPQTTKSFFEMVKDTKNEAERHRDTAHTLSQPLQNYITAQLNVSNGRLRRCTNIHHKIHANIDDVMDRYDDSRRIADGLDDQVVLAREKLDKLKDKQRQKKLAGKLAKTEELKFKKEIADVRLAKFRAERSRNVYILNKAGMNSMLEEYYATYLPDILSLLDDGYCTTTSTVMSHYHDALDHMFTESLTGLEKFHRSFNAIDEEREHVQFLKNPVFIMSELAKQAKGILRSSDDMATPLVEFDGSKQHLWRELKDAKQRLGRFLAEKEKVNETLAMLSNAGKSVPTQSDMESVANQWFDMKYQYIVLVCDEARLKAWIERIDVVGIKDDSFKEGDADVYDYRPGEEDDSDDEVDSATQQKETPKPQPMQSRIVIANSVPSDVMVMREIVKTEVTFKEAMEHLIEYFYEPLLEAYRTGREFLTDEQMNRIFSSVKPLIKFSEKLIEKLENNETVEGVAEVFTNFEESTNLFGKFASTFDWSTKLVADMYSNSSSFAYWLRHQEEDAGSSFESLFLTPIQRLPRFVLLLKELKKQSKNTSEQAEAKLDKAIAELETATTTVNNQVREAENTALLTNIEDRCANLPRTFKISKPGRHLVLQWEARVILGPENVLRGNICLFSDVILIASPITVSDQIKRKISTTGRKSGSEERVPYEYAYKAHFYLHHVTTSIVNGKYKTPEMQWVDNLVAKYSKYLWAGIFKDSAPLFWFGIKEQASVLNEKVLSMNRAALAFKENTSGDVISSPAGLQIRTRRLVSTLPKPSPRPKSSLVVGVLNLKSTPQENTKNLRKKDGSKSESNSPASSPKGLSEFDVDGPSEAPHPKNQRPSSQIYSSSVHSHSKGSGDYYKPPGDSMKSTPQQSNRRQDKPYRPGQFSRNQKYSLSSDVLTHSAGMGMASTSNNASTNAVGSHSHALARRKSSMSNSQSQMPMPGNGASGGQGGGGLTSNNANNIPYNMRSPAPNRLSKQGMGMGMSSPNLQHTMRDMGVGDAKGKQSSRDRASSTSSGNGARDNGGINNIPTSNLVAMSPHIHSRDVKQAIAHFNQYTSATAYAGGEGGGGSRGSGLQSNIPINPGNNNNPFEPANSTGSNMNDLNNRTGNAASRVGSGEGHSDGGYFSSHGQSKPINLARRRTLSGNQQSQPQRRSYVPPLGMAENQQQHMAPSQTHQNLVMEVQQHIVGKTASADDSNR
ncbi:hypothetical protein SARC_01796 [Sphaeroforma arctica JP610]|uniref:DH domain-containing protein n=1 Tax=Sphaeroforma arctica JP610 TaxID=667725 RepID=A0A0L0GAI5_9EUKA|nr:hypothetical protein SARC_01796 [Sphaeroforma arctica JP610]KNC86037.1 hypothetical protein SARC_01796 [Sphaeroforma arctica JP610]|eukprot:XP_014159939.1 hypothetical protein SARC_01796 [Sphaeroforma arctica JP610]